MNKKQKMWAGVAVVAVAAYYFWNKKKKADDAAAAKVAAAPAATASMVGEVGPVTKSFASTTSTGQSKF